MERTKLTLSIDRSVVEQAKEKAAKQRTTVSAMVETFLRQATTGTRTTPQYTAATDPELPEDLKILDGCLKDYRDLDPDEVRYQHLKEKYLHE